MNLNSYHTHVTSVKIIRWKALDPSAVKLDRKFSAMVKRDLGYG